MTAAGVARAVGLIVTCLVLVASGAYVLVDLARWEWNRAMLSALIFLSALVILATASVLRGLRRLGDRLSAMEGNRSHADIPGIIGTANAEAVAERRFAWLERPDRLGVFVPVLLGAGMVLSLVAYVIERLAGALAGGSLDRRTAHALHLELPLGSGLVHVDPGGRRSAAQRPHRTLLLALGALLTIGLGAGAIEGLRHLTQTRADAVGGPGTTTIGLRIDQKSVDRPLAVVVADLWIGCHNRVPGNPAIVDVRQVDDRHLVVTVDQAFGRVGRARIIGCLEDLTLDLALADVLTFDSVPAAAPSG